MIFDTETLNALADALAPRILAGLQRGTLTVGELVAAKGTPALVSDEPFSVEGFAGAIGRSKVWVYRKIAARRIAVLPTGKPYQIPRTEVAKWKKAKGTVA